MKYKLTIAYNGANYAGWQTQKSGIAVQQRVEEAAQKIYPAVKTGHLRSSSRTDAGVHALGMVAHLEVPDCNVPGRKLSHSINAFLPDDIRVLSATRCHADFDARFDAKGKQYRYFVWNHPAMNPLLIGQAWHVARPLDLKVIRAAAKLFPGRHDFKSLEGTRKYKMESTVRTLHRCDVKRSGPLLTFIIEGDGFLYKMCRGIVGTLVQAGQGKIAPDAIAEILRAKDRRAAGMTAPAHGLVLWKVYY